MVRRSWTTREIALAAAFTLVLLAMVTLYIWYQTESVRLSYETDRLRARLALLKEDIRRLEAERSRLLALDRVEGTARRELGLTDPQPGQVIYEQPPSGARKKRP
jgi:cell division protein FtsL